MSDYLVRVRGIGGLMGPDVALECETDDQALTIGWSIGTPYGHTVCAGRRLLGVFEAGWGHGFPEDDISDVAFMGDNVPVADDDDADDDD